MSRGGGKDGERLSLNLGDKSVCLLFVRDEFCGPPDAGEDITRGGSGGEDCNVANSWHDEQGWAGRFSSYLFPWAEVIGGGGCVWCCAVPAPGTKTYTSRQRQK